MKISVEWLEANGFRAFCTPVRFEFGAENRISGPNGAGKSSIMEGIAFAVAGVDKEGKANAADRLMSKGCSEMSLSVGIRVGDQLHRIDRHVIKHRNKTETTIYLNNNKSNQDQVDVLVANKKHFMASFLLDYFCMLDTKDARVEMMALLPTPTDEEVLTALEESDANFASALTGAKLTDPDVFISREKDQLQAFKDELLRLEGESRSIEDALKAEIPLNVQIDYKPTEDLRASIQAIEQARPKEKDVSGLLDKMRELQAEHSAIQRNLDFDENIVICEKCGHHNNLAAEQEKKNAEITLRMTEINREYGRLSNDAEAIRNENRLMLKNFEEANSETLSVLREQLREMESNLKLVEHQNMSVDVLIEAKAKAKERSLSIQTEQTNIKKYIENAELRIKAAQAFKVKKCEIQVDTIKSSLDRVSIRLFEIVKSTGEIKPTFKLEYDGKEYRVLSTSEKVRCGLEISRLIRKLAGREYPVFIDNAESIIHFERPDVQLFVARVVEREELNLEVVA